MPLSPICRNPVLPWIALFWTLSLFVYQGGGPNVSSRVAALRAVTVDHVLNIDRNVSWTMDWALAPDGHYYSNKAPGAFLIALPIFAVLDGVDRYLNSPEYPSPWVLVTLCFVLQILPLSYFVLRISDWMEHEGHSLQGIHFFAVASLIGNTAAVYASSYFGHTLAAIFFLAATEAWLRKSSGRAAFYMAAAVLTDYMAILLLPGFLWVSLRPGLTSVRVRSILIGASPVILLFGFYHAVVFGRPWRLASQYINPSEVMVLPNRHSLFGTVGVFPDFDLALRLLFGTERGILFTQPWILVSLILMAFGSRRLIGLGVWLGSGFLFMLWLNASVGGWHGGWAVGPRYLCLIFPAVALYTGLIWDGLRFSVRALLGAGLIVAVLFRLWIFPFSNLAPVTNLWSYFWEEYASADLKYSFGHLLLGVVLTLTCAAWARRTVGAGARR